MRLVVLVYVSLSQGICSCKLGSNHKKLYTVASTWSLVSGCPLVPPPSLHGVRSKPG
ncbi:hypothetical protein BO99DRAFT_404438 [Aspergillus violaceofuscus CBS 115571]|uniref:Uncharacterized protein n=1 Tax=Aspergillus violaceofuscus (strain CBS 115571) TaxID=1450538 RepID=A0A2V5H0B9_ASPV1|nr:hypothetical protein BO99DRAFT_404438 [Aspergillus violaceofuscus CBS 115571]